MTVYLAVTIPPLEYALRHTTNGWIDQLKERFSCLRWIPKRDVVRGLGHQTLRGPQVLGLGCSHA
jgi:hypothetical protein